MDYTIYTIPESPEKKTFDRYMNNHKDMDKAPIKMTALANRLGIKVWHVKELEDNISGMLAKNEDGKWEIYVNGKHSRARRRFTVAHEIGHFLLHKEEVGDGIIEDRFLRAEGLTNSQEAEANAFAADVLMPFELMSQFQQDGITDPKELSDKFDVSDSVMRIRLSIQRRNSRF